MKDSEVPWSYATKIIDHIDQPDTRLTLIKGGDHRLSAPHDLNMLWKAVEEFV